MVAEFVDDNGDGMASLSAEATSSQPVRLGRGCSVRCGGVCGQEAGTGQAAPFGFGSGVRRK